MSKSNTWEVDLLKLVFQNISTGLIGDAVGLQASGTAGVFWLSLHTADPTEGGTQNSSEATYTNYTRISLVRSSSAWTVTPADSGPSTATNVSQVTFPQAGIGSPLDTVTHIGVGTASTSFSTTITAGSNGQALPQATINVVSTTGFPASGTIIVFTNAGAQTVTYTGTTATTFTGCSGGTGTMSTGGSVSTSKLIYSGALASSLAVSQNITPSFAPGTLVITED